jgi:hypothetical protein
MRSIVIQTPERCYLCRREIPEGQVYRRVMPVSDSSGWLVGTAIGHVGFVTRAPVSLCRWCHEEEVFQAWWNARPGIGSLLGWLFFSYVAGFFIGVRLGGEPAGLWGAGGGVGIVLIGRMIAARQRRKKKKRWEQRQEALYAQSQKQLKTDYTTTSAVRF